jgi:hypothetical protein
MRRCCDVGKRHKADKSRHVIDSDHLGLMTKIRPAGIVSTHAAMRIIA